MVRDFCEGSIAMKMDARSIVAAGLMLGSMQVCMELAGEQRALAQSGVTATQAAQPSSSSQAGRAATLHDELEKIREKHGVPAVAGAVVTTDGLWAMSASGLRAADRDEDVTARDQFHLGSCTKAMTATLCAILVEEGVISWDLTLDEALPELNDSMHEKYRDVTIADLLTQRSGVPSEMNRDGLWGKLWQSTADVKEQRADCTKTMLSWGPDHAASKFVYANANFIIVGHVLEVKTGKSWEDLMREKLFNPLGMTTAGFGAPGEEGKFDQPQGHRNATSPAGVGKGADNPAALGPAGTVHASMEDWGKFVSLHLRGAKAAREGKGVEVGNVTIKPETFRKLHEPVKGNGADYAMGWGVTERPWAKGENGKMGVITHNGSNTMWMCVVWAAPDAGFAVLSATNIGGDVSGKACDDVAGTLIGMYQKAK
jgi:CubicO group peptidase (beta-lactamase class C family)